MRVCNMADIYAHRYVKREIFYVRHGSILYVQTCSGLVFAYIKYRKTACIKKCLIIYYRRKKVQE